ncbi:MAG: hypothetical protein NTY46_05505 [Candidatus Sumerlaeota bacterium]|nr:hypothetical protein [Candidatus Sumerlaeota bacterium]
MNIPSDIGLLSPSALVKLVLALVAKNRALGAENESLRLENALLRGEIEGLKRALGSGASPYSSNRRKSPLKRPGRKAGEGSFSRRQAPRFGVFGYGSASARRCGRTVWGRHPVVAEGQQGRGGRRRTGWGRSLRPRRWRCTTISAFPSARFLP